MSERTQTQKSAAANREVIVVSDAASVARRGAEELCAAAERAAAKKSSVPFTVALAGGSTPRLLYALLADGAQPFRARLPWSRMHFFFGDERHVPPDHADSNYRMADETLFAPASVARDHVHRIHGDDPDAEHAARDYENELRAFFQLRAEPGVVPRFDAILLGMGADGHTASIFPGSPVIAERARLVAAPYVEKFRCHRITLTPPVLNGADLVLFLVTGAEKAATLARVLEGEHSPREYPSQLVAPASGVCRWITDEGAAAGLARP